MEPMTMTSSKPYMLRAIYEWIIDNEMTPYIVLDAEYAGVQVPSEYVEDGRIILNISPEACRGLHLENDRVVFTARFNGVAQQIFAPPAAAMAIYAKETGKGMVFAEEKAEEGDGSTEEAAAPAASGSSNANSKSSPSSRKRGPSLKVVK